MRALASPSLRATLSAIARRAKAEAKQSICPCGERWIASSRSLPSGARSRYPLAPRNDGDGCLKTESANSRHLAPLAGRGTGRLQRPSLRAPKQSFGYVASTDAIRVRGTLRESNTRKQPLTPTLIGASLSEFSDSRIVF